MWRPLSHLIARNERGRRFDARRVGYRWRQNPRARATSARARARSFCRNVGSGWANGWLGYGSSSGQSVSGRPCWTRIHAAHALMAGRPWTIHTPTGAPLDSACVSSSCRNGLCMAGSCAQGGDRLGRTAVHRARCSAAVVALGALAATYAHHMTFNEEPPRRRPLQGFDVDQSGRPDSNRRRPAWEAGILPTELRPQTSEKLCEVAEGGQAPPAPRQHHPRCGSTGSDAACATTVRAGQLGE